MLEESLQKSALSLVGVQKSLGTFTSILRDFFGGGGVICKRFLGEFFQGFLSVFMDFFRMYEIFCSDSPLDINSLRKVI